MSHNTEAYSYEYMGHTIQISFSHSTDTYGFGIDATGYSPRGIFSEQRARSRAEAECRRLYSPEKASGQNAPKLRD
jgi:hypothetical protein